MADIYLKPYDSRRNNPGGKILLVVIVLVLVGGGWWMIASHHSSKKEAQLDSQVDAPLTLSEPSSGSSEWSVPDSSDSELSFPTPAAANPPVSSRPAVVPPVVSSVSVPRRSSPDAEAEAQQLFTRAQGLVSAGKLQDASDLFEKVIAIAPDAGVRNSAVRVQGRINMDLFLSQAPTPEKKPYVIQPGDSLDRIARRNHTTVELLQRMNKIDGNLIYPGTTILVPAAPFVIHVDKSAKTLELVINNKRIKRYSVGLGRYGKTPLGRFLTVVHQKNPDWTQPTGGIVPFGDPRNVLGTRWMSIQDDSRPQLRGFGIHGTTQRDSIGGETSNGCVRMLNEDVEEVFMLVSRGTEVLISE